MMFSKSVSVWKTGMIFAVALVVSFSVAAASSVGGRFVDTCVLQKNTIVEEFKLSTLDPMFGEVLTTESNNKIYVVSICRPVPKMFYDPRKLSGAIKLTPGGNTVNLGRIDQSNVIVNENSIVLTYVGGDRDTDVEDTCKGLRWKTYLTFLCDPSAIHDILTLIDEDPDQPEICQVWFQVTTSKICDRKPHLPLVILDKDISALKNQAEYEKHTVRESTHSYEIPSRKNAFDYEASNINKNKIFTNIANKEKPNINDLNNKFNKSFRNEHFRTIKENKTTNEEIERKNGNSIQINSKYHKKQSNSEDKDNYLNKYKTLLYEKYENEEAKLGHSKTNTPEDKMLADHIMYNKLWIEKNMPHYENKEHYPSNDFGNKFTYFKINNTMPGASSNKEYRYPGKNESISHYNNLKNYLNQNKNAEGKYENSVISESTKYIENKYGKLNPENALNDDTKYKKFIENENIENTSSQNTFENKTSNKEMNDSGENKIPSDNEKKLKQDNSKKSNPNNDPRTYNTTPNSDNGIIYNTTADEHIFDTSYQSESKDNNLIIYDNNVPGDVTKENKANQTHSKNSNPESKSSQTKDQKNEIENNSKIINGSITESTSHADSTAENKAKASGDKSIDTNSINMTKHSTNDDANQMNSQNNNPESESSQKDQKNEIENNPTNVNGSITESTPHADSTAENKAKASGDKSIDTNTINTTKHSTNDDANQINSQNNNPESEASQKDQNNEIENNPTNVNGSITESTTHANSTAENKAKASGDKSIDANTINTTKLSTNDDTNQINSQNNNPESESSQKDQNNAIENNSTNVNGSITESTPRADSTTANKAKASGDKSVDANTINTANTNDYNSTSGSYNNTTSVTVKPTKTSSLNTKDNDYTNESGEVNVSSTESPVDGSSYNIKTNNESEPNGTITNEINNINKNLQPDQSTLVPSAQSSDSVENDDIITTSDSTSQSGDGFSFDKMFSDIFPNGIHISAATIIGSLVSLTAVTGIVGVGINRYYYKLSGTDQIPFKGTFQSIFNSIKAIILSICCCCRRSGYDDLEAPNLTNEKTPLLQPKFNISTPLIVDETSQKSSDGSNNGDSKENSSNEYGSISNEKKSLVSKTKVREQKRKSKNSDTTEDELLVKNVKGKLTNIENDLQGKSIKEIISGKISKIFTEKLKPTISSIVEKVEKKVESTDEIKKNLDKISKEAASISKFVEDEKSTKNTDDVQVDVEIKSENNSEKTYLNEKSTKNTDDVQVDVEIESENNSEKTHLNEIKAQNVAVQEEIKSTTLGESQQSPNAKPVPDLQQIERNDQGSDMKTSELDKVIQELIESTQDIEDIVIKNNIEKVQNHAVTDTKAKINESKLKFLGFEKEDNNVQNVVTDKSIASNKNIENEEDDVEVIEEIIYIDGADGDEEEEIIEEIIETTTIEDSPDTLDESLPGSGHTKVTVHTTRKISSSSLPGEVRTIEETVVTDGVPENEKKQSGFQFGVGKSGISMSVGDKKMEIGKSGLKLNRSKSKSPMNVEGDEPDKRDTKSPEKSKKSMSMPKIFKRSISQPADDDIQEGENEAASTKKLSRTGSGLLKFGKSRSKSTVVLKTGDVTIDTDAMLNFIDHERNSSRLSNVGQGEFDLSVGDEDVASAVVVRKTSTTTSDGKNTPVTIETVEISPKDFGLGSASEPKPTKSPETKSNAKTKREKKGKTKLTTLTRPF